MAENNQAIEDAIIVARVGLLISQPFWGNIATRLILKDVTDEGWCETAATDGRHFYYNREFVKKLSVKELQFLIGHEIGHCVFDHFGRRGDRNATVWNIAGDFVINDTLIEGHVGEPIKVVRPLWDAKYRGMYTEEVYDLINEEYSDEELAGMTSIDVHLPIEGDQDSDGDDGKGKVTPKISKDEIKKIRDEFREAVVSAAQSSGAGNLPGAIKRLIKEFTNPKISWRSLLRQQIQSVIKSDFSWSRPNKKTWSSGIYLPGMDTEQTIDVCVAIDTSGSIDAKMLQDFFGEIAGLMEQYQNFNIKIWCFDTQVYNPREFTEHNRHELVNYEIQGFGGTDFMANYRWMKDNDIRPKKFIMFTDGYPFGAWGDPEYCDTVFIIHGNENIEPPFGVWAHYDRKKRK